jgi:hypothetical protein
MVQARDLSVQYLTDESGRKTSVVLPIEQFYELLDDIDDLAAVAERREEPSLTHEQVLTELRRDGFLQD